MNTAIDVTPRDARLARPRMLKRLRQHISGTRLATLCVVVAAICTMITPIVPLPAPNHQDLTNTLGPFTSSQWLGTDELGRDLFSRLLWGVHTSFLAAVTAVVVAFVVGLPLGLIAGYWPGWLDQVVTRLSDIVLTVPPLILLLAAQTALDTGIEGQMVILGLIFAPRIIRIVRVETQRLVTSPFVVAGRMSGCSHRRVLGRYLFPGVQPQLAVQTSYLMGLALVVEAGISFLRIGVKPPDASLGTLLSNASSLLANEPRVILIPAAVVTLLILSFNVLGDRLTKEDVR